MVLGASAFSFALMSSGAAFTQALEAEVVTRSPEQKKQKQAKRQQAKPQQDAQATAAAMNARAQAGATAVQSLDTITVAASKTEERAIDALAPVSVVTLEQIQGLQPNRLSGILYQIPGVSVQERGDDPSTVINIRGLQDFGRVAVVVDGARQNYQRTGHNANGSFFLDPELVGSVDVVRGPTANIYGSGAIGGVVSFRTKDINDVVRPGERWGVDMTGSGGTNSARGLGSIFGGVRADPNVDVFGGAVYRTQGNYKDGNGTEIGNTGNEIAAGLMKVTVRPAEGHEIKFGGIFQDYQYSIGQLNRGPTTTSAPLAAIAGTSVYASDAKNYTGTVTWKYSKPDDNLWDWNVSLYGNRTENDQVKTYNNRITTGGGVCTLANPGNNISGCVGDRRGYVLDTLGIDVYNTTRFNVGDWRNAVTLGVDAFQDDVRTSDSRGNSNITTPGGLRTVSGGFAQLKQNYSTWFEAVSAIRYDRYDLHSPTVATGGGGDRFSPKITIGVTPVAGFTPYVSYAEGYRAPVDHRNADRRRARHRRWSAALSLSGRHCRAVLFPAQPEFAAGGRQEQGSRASTSSTMTCSRPATASAASSTCSATMSLITSISLDRRRGRPSSSLFRASSASSISTRTSRRPGSKASRPRRCMTQACGMSASPAT